MVVVKRVNGRSNPGTLSRKENPLNTNREGKPVGGFAPFNTQLRSRLKVSKNDFERTLHLKAGDGFDSIRV